jgi:hypothetical protein
MQHGYTAQTATYISRKFRNQRTIAIIRNVASNNLENKLLYIFICSDVLSFCFQKFLLAKSVAPMHALRLNMAYGLYLHQGTMKFAPPHPKMVSVLVARRTIRVISGTYAADA